MSDKLSLDIQESIKKNLPAQLSDILQKRIVELEGKESKLESLENSLIEKNKEITYLQDKVKKDIELETKSSLIESRELAVRKKELEQERDDFKLKAEEAEKRAGLAKEFVTLIFRNTTLRENTFESRDIPLVHTNHYNGGSNNSVQMYKQTDNYSKSSIQE